MLAAVAVAAGAFGSHALSGKISAQDLETWRTASQYLLIHAVALVAIGLCGRDALKIPALLLLTGSIVFSLSLFVLVISDVRGLGAVTPIGGVLMICGWLLTAITLARGTIQR